MNQPDTTAGGFFSFVLLVALPAGVALSVLTRLIYRRAVEKTMWSPVPAGSAPFVDEPPTAPDRRPLTFDIAELQAGPQSRPELGLRYFIAGMAFAATAAVTLLVLEGIEFSAFRVVVVTLIFAWPAVPFAVHVAGYSRGVVALAAVGYLAVVMGLGVAVSASPVDGIVLPIILILPGMIAALIVSNRLMRTTSVTMFLVSTVFISLLLLLTDVVLAINERSGSDIAVIVGVLAIGSLILACWFLGPRAVVLATRRSSDLLVQSDAIWLILTAWLIIFTVDSVGVAALWFVASFAAYRLGLYLVTRKTMDPDPPLLLLLRVFGNRKQQEQLSFGMLTRWRQYGPVMLLGAADLATETLDPPELVAFLSGSLHTIFVRSPQDLALRLNESRAPLSDGLYPVQDFFCQQHSWRPTANALMARATAVVLDLRGFSAENTGVRWEIAQLVRRVPVERIVLLTDASTDVPLAQNLFLHEWYEHTGIGLAPPGAPIPNHGAKLVFSQMVG